MSVEFCDTNVIVYAYDTSGWCQTREGLPCYLSACGEKEPEC